MSKPMDKDALSFSQLQTIHKDITGKNIKKTDNNLKIDLNTSEGKKLLESLSKYSLTGLKSIKISQIKSFESTTLNEFLNKSIPPSLPEFHFHSNQNRVLCSTITGSLCRAVSSISNIIYLGHLVLSDKNIEQLFSSCNSETLEFISCLFDFRSAPNLSFISEFGIKNLCFKSMQEDKGKEKKWFEVIIESISKSKEIKENLEKVSCKKCEIVTEEMEEIVKKYGMDKVKVVAQND